MLNKEMMEKAEARCLELVNDGEVYKRYDPLFRAAAEKLGIQVLSELVDEAKRGEWAGVTQAVRFHKIPIKFVIEWENLRDSKKFHTYDGVRQRNDEFSRTVFGLVLEDWLINHRETTNYKESLLTAAYPEPEVKPAREFKGGEKVRVLTDASATGSRALRKGEVYHITGFPSEGNQWAGHVYVNGWIYHPDNVELVEPYEEKPLNPCAEIAAEDYAVEDALEEARKLTNSANARIERINSILNKKETVMSLKIETKTFVNGAEIAKLSVEELVSLIQRTEDEIKKLEALANKPKKVQQKIQQLTDGLAELVKFADAE